MAHVQLKPSNDTLPALLRAPIATAKNRCALVLPARYPAAADAAQREAYKLCARRPQ